MWTDEESDHSDSVLKSWSNTIQLLLPPKSIALFQNMDAHKQPSKFLLSQLKKETG